MIILRMIVYYNKVYGKCLHGYIICIYVTNQKKNVINYKYRLM